MLKIVIALVVGISLACSCSKSSAPAKSKKQSHFEIEGLDKLKESQKMEVEKFLGNEVNVKSVMSGSVVDLLDFIFMGQAHFAYSFKPRQAESSKINEIIIQPGRYTIRAMFEEIDKQHGIVVSFDSFGTFLVSGSEK